MSFLRLILFSIATFSLLLGPHVSAQEVHQDIQGIWRAKVIEVINQEKRIIPGTDTQSTYQTIKAELLEGERKGQVVTIENDYLTLKNGDKFFLFYTIDINGNEMYSVRDIDRRVTIGIFVGLFILTIIAFGGKQGLRSIISLAGSFFVILYVLVPSLLKGYPPVLTSIAIAAIILFLAIFLTHGFNRESLVAFIGTVIAVILTGILAYLGVKLASLSGFASDEAVYLNLATRGALNFSGL
ncbi:MAG: YibE/F family protein, partial [Nitrosopumilus sp.]|nr:YibE/F family protein [Nitrosopumilus sp.]